MTPSKPEQIRTTYLFYLKLGLLFFWACWFSLACTTNFFDFMYALGNVSSSWLFRSGNYALLQSVVKIYDVSPQFLHILFICDIAVQGLSAVLFFIAFICYWTRSRPWQFINAAFALSIALWAVFLLMEEIFIAYRFEGVHIGLLMFELITLMAMHVLPEN